MLSEDSLRTFQKVVKITGSVGSTLIFFTMKSQLELLPSIRSIKCSQFIRMITPSIFLREASSVLCKLMLLKQWI